MSSDNESIEENSSHAGHSDIDVDRTSSASDETQFLDENTTANGIWDQLQRITWSGNKEFWYKLLSTEKKLFRMKFKECFIETCRNQLANLSDFIENDETWNALMETKSKIFEDLSEDDEALLSAIDTRKYRIFKTIDWSIVEADIQEDTDDSDVEEDPTDVD